jgi:RNA polymerase sigma-70 factor (ECF subfamily)
MDPDRALVDRARAGDLDAFGELVRKYQHRLVNYASALLSNVADAEDVTQEAFLRAYRGLARFRGASSFKTWLYQIVTNAARTHLAHRRAGVEVSGEGQAAGSEDALPGLDDLPGPEDLESAVVRRDRIDRALAGLPPDLRETVVLRDVEGLDYREIAAALDIPMGTVESRIFRARQRLRTALVGT